MRQLQVTHEFRHQFGRLPQPVQGEVTDVAQLLRSDPLEPTLNPKRLVRVAGNQYRVRLGQYRLVYSFTPKTLLLRTIGRRGNVYQRLKRWTS